jgi:glycine/D-amino acid oxidase-like deaminating enzyme
VRGETVVLATLDRDEHERLAAIPSVLARLRDHPTYADLYLVPPTDYPDGTVRLKLGATSEPYLELPTAEARRDWMRGDDHARELAALRGLVKALVPGVRALAWETKPCLITETPSDLPYLDHVAEGLVLAAGGNGYAAKSANAIGALAARLALEGRWTDPALDPARFAAS